MPASNDFDDRLISELGLGIAQGYRPLRKRGEHIERGQGSSSRLQPRDALDQLVEQSVIQPLFACEGAVSGAQDLVLELLEFGRDVALRVADGLPADVVGWHPVREAAVDLDEVALHAVVAEFQVADAAAHFFTCFEIKQVLVAVFADQPQLIQLGVVARGNHAAFAQDWRG